MRKILEQCPSCGGQLVISEVRCQNCATEVRSQYRPCDFCSLSEEQATFVRLFVQSRGKLNAMEELLGVSYPTVSSKLDEIIGRLQAGAANRPAAAPTTTLWSPVPPIPPVPPVPPIPAVRPGFTPRMAEGHRQDTSGLSRQDILGRLSAGELTAAEALSALKELGRQGRSEGRQGATSDDEAAVAEREMS